MSWNPTAVNIKYRSQAVTTPQASAQACVPYWFRETDDLVPVIIKPIQVVDDVLTFDVYDTDTEDLLNVEKSLYLLDDRGLTGFFDLPSTVMEWVRNPSLGDYCLVLLTKDFAFTTLGLPGTVEVVPSGVDEGKWPRTAAGLSQPNRLVKTIEKVLKTKGVAKLLDPNDVQYLKGLLLSARGK